MTDKNTRYDNVPLSEHTRKGMTLNSNDLQAIGRLLMLQDDVYEEQFEKLCQGQKDIEKQLEGIKKMLDNHEKRITCLEAIVEKLTA
jgi:archaellum component FlaC